MGARARSTSFAGPYTREDGFLGYNEICEVIALFSKVMNASIKIFHVLLFDNPFKLYKFYFRN